jgi:uncharacterized protein (TIGR00266 family)
MNIQLLQQPDSAIARVILDAGEELVAQAGAMIAMNANIDVNTTLRQGKGGGIMGGLKRMLAGQSLFLSVFRSPVTGSEILLAPKMMGDMMQYQMNGNELIVQSSSYLASESDVDMELGFTGLKSLFSGESIFWLKMSGYGAVLLTSFGGIYSIDIDGDYIVDTGHIVAFENTLEYQITKPSASWIGSFLGGEGFVCRFHGKGKLYCQTHNAGAFGSLVGSQLPPR